MTQTERCKLRNRKDDIPKRSKEKSWSCDTCGALMFAPKKPGCVRQQIQTIREQAAAEAHRLHMRK